MIEKYYQKIINLSKKNYALPFLLLVAFVESFIFPIPPDIFLILLILAQRYNAFYIAFLCTIFSVLGGILGYFLGTHFFDIGIQIMNFYGYEDKVINLKKNLLSNEGFYAWLGILFLAGFTPLPYKVFTISSGLIGFNILIFILISLISRGLRFYIVAYLSFKFGDMFTQFMNKHGSKSFTIVGIFIVILGLIIYLIFKSYV